MRANQELWSFLNLKLAGKVESKYQSIKRFHGLDAWRLVVTKIEPKTFTKRRELHRKVHHPAQVKKLSEVMDAITAWEKNRDDYYECGRQTIEEAEQCTIILDILPESTPHSMMMGFEAYCGD